MKHLVTRVASCAVACMCAVVVFGVSCAPSSSRTVVVDNALEAFMAPVTLPVSGNVVDLGVSLEQLPDIRARFLATIDAWVEAYPLPGTRFRVVRYTGSPHSWRTPGLIRLSWWLEAGRYVVGDCSWEIPHAFYGLDDPPPLGVGPVSLPLDDAARRARAVALLP